jgi:ABC-type transport system involved in multi-copper enzyme maturation permease subunit
MQINRKIRKKEAILGAVLLVMLAGYTIALILRIRWLAMLCGPLLFVAACFGITFALWPDLRYRNFLRDLDSRLTQEISGTVLSVSQEAELQDGAMVFPVHIRLDKDQDDHIVYLNASKAEGFPPAGTKVILQCGGRHIRDIQI